MTNSMIDTSFTGGSTPHRSARWDTSFTMLNMFKDGQNVLRQTHQEYNYLTQW